MTGLPIIKFPQFFGGQLGVPGSESPFGIRAAAGNAYYVGKAVGEIDPSDGNDGTDPLAPKATLAGALAECVSGRGDVVVLLPGDYAIAAAVPVTKDAVKIVSWDYLCGYSTPSATLDGAGLVNILDIDADGVEIAGLRFSNDDTDDVACIRAAVNGAIDGLYIHDNAFECGLSGITLGVGANVPANVVISNNQFLLLENTAGNKGITVVGATRTLIERNTFWSALANAAHGIGLPNAATPGVLIRENDFIFEAAGVGIFRAGANASGYIGGNRFYGAGTPITVAADGGDHAVENYNATNAGGALVDATT